MARRKVSHHRRIISKSPGYMGRSVFGDIVEFKYVSEDIYDRTPLVFVLTKSSKVLNGININYLTEALVQKLLLEKDPKNLKNYSLYTKAFRTYSLSKVKMVKDIEYKTDEMLREEREDKKL